MRIRVFVREPDLPANSNAILFTGRGGTAEDFVWKYAKHLRQTRLIGLQPTKQWYPIPNGAGDQEEAINGLRENLSFIKRKVDDVIERFDVSMGSLVFAGYSAGAVVCLKLIIDYEMNISLAVLHSGALFETADLRDCNIKTPIMLIHSKDDECFSWDERYLPMKNALAKRKYNLSFLEKSKDGHLITDDDVRRASCEIERQISKEN